MDSAREPVASPWRGRRVAVTGGAGFVGAALVRTLLGQGAQVVAVDLAPFDRLADVANHPHLQCRHGDVRDPIAMAEYLRGCELVLHLAAVVCVQRYLADPLAVLDVNVNGARVVAEVCRAQGCALLLASTSEVYGTLAVDLREDAPVQLGNLHSPRWSYALSKACAERIVLARARAGMRAAVVRYFNVYGPEIDAPGQGRVLSQFLGQLQAGAPLRLVDGGAAVRSFCYVDDAVCATLLLAQRLLAEPLPAASEPDPAPVVGQIVNIGRREPVTMAELAGHVLRLAGSDVGTTPIAGDRHFGAGFEEIPRRVPVLDRLERLTGYVAETSLESGLRKTLRHWGLLKPAAPLPDPAPVPFVVPDVRADAALLTACARVLASGRLANRGPEVLALEQELAALTGAPAVVAVSSGFAALVLALHLSRPPDPRRDAVLLPAFTFAATRNAVLAAGLRPVYVDVDAGDWTLDPDAAARELAGRRDVAALLPVTVFGVPADLAALRALADLHGCALVVDDAHGLGTTAAGTARDPGLCDARALSLHATKTVVAGEGGALALRDEAQVVLARELSNHGLRADGRLHPVGWNFKLPELAATLARHSLRSLTARLARRRQLAERLLIELGADGPLVAQTRPAGVQSCWQNFGALVRDRSPGARDACVDRLRRAGVEARRYFWPALVSPPNGHASKPLPVTTDVEHRILCLPLHDGLGQRDAAALVTALGQLHHQEAPWPRLTALP